MRVKTIDVIAKEWFDRANGNSYFSATVTINFGLKNAKQFTLPFQYGYGEQHVQEARELLIKEKLINLNVSQGQAKHPLWRYCRENNIILRTTKHENCLKRDVLRYSME